MRILKNKGLIALLIIIGVFFLEFNVFASHETGTNFSDVSMLDPHTGALWPGGEYGSTKAQLTSEDDRGRCINCHWPYRWNDDDPTVPDPANYPISGLLLEKYPKMFVEQYDITDNGKDPDDAEDLCYTCHDSNGPSRFDVKTPFEKSFHMPTSIQLHMELL